MPKCQNECSGTISNDYGVQIVLHSYGVQIVLHFYEALHFYEVQIVLHFLVSWLVQ